MTNIPTAINIAKDSPVEEELPSVKKDPSRVMKSSVEPPFSMYKTENKLPFTADYLDVKLTWDQADMVDDVMAIDDYLSSLVKSGELGDSTKQAKEKLKKLEKFAGIDQLESQAQRIIKLSEFVKYLQKLEGRKHDIF